MPPFEGVNGPIPLLRLVDISEKEEVMFALDELGFDHVFHRLSAETSPEDLPKAYTACIKHLDILHKDYSKLYLDCGVTVIVTSNWLFLSPIYKPIARELDCDVFLDPLSYLGILHLPILQKLWPETAGIDVGTGLPLELLAKASKHVDEDLIPF